jgi:hypothetical protein
MRKYATIVGGVAVVGLTMKVAVAMVNDDFPEYRYTIEKRIFNLHKEPSKKEKIVVLGSGWGAMSFIHHIDRENVDLTVISPRSYFFYTPLLAGVAAGTVNHNSIIEPVRWYCPQNEHSRYVQGLIYYFYDYFIEHEVLIIA